MPVPVSLANLTDEHRRQIELWLGDLAQSWDEKRLSGLVRRLPPPGDPIRLPALSELVKADLEHQWRSGRRVRLEAYLRAWPELGTPDTVALDMIQAEIQARQLAGETINREKLAERFPRQAPVVQLPGEPAPNGGVVPPAETRRSSPAARASTRSDSAPGAADVPEQIGRYRILRQLGQGGMGAVYLAHDTQLDRQVALKVPRFSAEGGGEILARFQREARYASSLSHPNICPIYEIGETNGVHYVTMAYIEGKPLSDLIRGNKPLPQRPAAAVVRKLARAMEEAHSKGIIHRDLKPANVMINHRNEPVIMDFGLTRRVNEEVELTRKGSMVGTPAYMAPEQIRGNREELGPACDIYSLGVILYELLTGQLPFQGPLPSIIGQVLTRDPDPPSTLRADLDPQLEAICLKAMAKRAVERYASMSDLAAALGKFLKAETSRPELEEVAAAEEALPASVPAPSGVAPTPPSSAGGKPGLATQLLAELAKSDKDSVPTGLEIEAIPPSPPSRVRTLLPWIIFAVGLVVLGAGVGIAVMVALNFK